MTTTDNHSWYASGDTGQTVIHRSVCPAVDTKARQMAVAPSKGLAEMRDLAASVRGLVVCGTCCPR